MVFATKNQKKVNAPETDNKPAPTSPMPNGVLITVAICTRNRARFLQRADENVLPQMTDKAELLIVDNASTDDTAAVAARLAAAHPRLTVCCENEIGVSAARNTALMKARGQYVLFFDDDELADAGWLQAYANFFRDLPSSRVGCVGGWVRPRCSAANNSCAPRRRLPSPFASPISIRRNFSTSPCALFAVSIPLRG